MREKRVFSCQRKKYFFGACQWKMIQYIVEVWRGTTLSVVGMLYKRGYEYLWIIIASILEPIFYHPIITFCSLRGYLSYLTNRDFKWKNMERKGFKQKEENTDDAETAAMKPEPATI